MGMRGWLIKILGGELPHGATPEYNESVKNTNQVYVDPLEEEAAGLNFKTAIEVHQRWKIRLKAVIDLNSQENLAPEIISQDDQCVLGKWIYGKGEEQFGVDPQFIHLRKKHAFFHLCAGKILMLAQAGKREKALVELTNGNYARISQEMIFDLAQMFTRFKKESLVDNKQQMNPMEKEVFGLNFKTAIEVHQRWKSQLKSVIDSKENLNLEAVTRDDICTLGKWIYGAGAVQFENDPLFTELRKTHRYFHVRAGVVITLAQDGDKEKAMAELLIGHFASVSQELMFDIARFFVGLTKSNAFHE